MYQLLLILGVVLLPEVDALQCYQCSSDDDDSCLTTECNSGSHCAAVRMTSYRGFFFFFLIVIFFLSKKKKNSEQFLCLQGSFNYGYGRIVYNYKCCSTNLCNDQPASEASLSPNSKKCFTCDAMGQNCDATLNCLGDEDRCFSTTVINVDGMTVREMGCASHEICETFFTPGQGGPGVDYECCQGDFCNSASSTSAGLLLSVVPLISLILFS
uniref:UPAR/Ly6 domain-containing protein n=1 Tax=Salarias fasciatus TaxID=181472 RepID=A0A672HWQ3_SALFA